MENGEKHKRNKEPKTRAHTQNQKHQRTHGTFYFTYFFFGKYDTFFYIKFLYITFFISYNPFIIFFAVSAVKEILYIIKIKINK